MWPWTPVPPDGAYSLVDSVCTLCPGGCGITVRKVENRAVKIEGMANHPVNRGGICILGASGLQLLYGHTRVEGPMRRTGQRGEGKWEKISWKEALSEVNEKLVALRTKREPHSLACISGIQGQTTARLMQRFLNAYGSPNYMTMPTVMDSYRVGLKMMQGSNGKIGFDFENSDYILSFGSAIIEGWGSPVRMFLAKSQWQGKARFVQIDPRLSNTAAKADMWVPVRPGTEADLALGLCHVAITENLFNQDFVDLYTQGFPKLKAFVLEKYSPETVSKQTGVEVATIQRLAREFGRAANPVAVCGQGDGQTPGSMKQVLAVQTLNALLGRINRKGGVWEVAPENSIAWADAQPDPTALAGLRNGRLDGAGTGQFTHSTSLVNRFQKLLADGKGYPINLLMVAESNPLYNLSETETVKNALAKIPFIVSFSSFMDDTSLHADLILPNHVYLERFEDIADVPGFQKPLLSLAKPVVSPTLNTRHLGDTIISMARNLGGKISEAFPWKSYTGCLRDTLGSGWDDLQKKVFQIDSGYEPNPFEYPTQSGKFEFMSERISDIELPGDEATFPLVLIPYDTMRLSSGFVVSTPFMMKTLENTVLNHNDIVVEINPKTAESLGLSEGSSALLSTPVSSATVRIHLFDGVMPGLVAMARGLGHDTQKVDPFLGGKGVNINQVLAAVEDPVSGLDACWGIRAKLAKA
jgi:anaerobic selenocysteine-containing dehydrogenase